DLGADVVEVPVYRLGAPAMETGPARLGEAAARRELDAVTFTSQAAARNLVAFGGAELVDRLAAAGVVCACVGPVTAAAAREPGPAAAALETTNRRGYRLAVA